MLYLVEDFQVKEQLSTFTAPPIYLLPLESSLGPPFVSGSHFPFLENLSPQVSVRTDGNRCEGTFWAMLTWFVGSETFPPVHAFITQYTYAVIYTYVYCNIHMQSCSHTLLIVTPHPALECTHICTHRDTFTDTYTHTHRHISCEPPHPTPPQPRVLIPIHIFL